MKKRRAWAMIVIVSAAASIALALFLRPSPGLPNPELPSATSTLLDPDGNFTLWVSNQSYAINPVDICVEINGELVISSYFDVGTQHTFVPFKLRLNNGKHTIRIWSTKGAAELSMEFDLNNGRVGVITYWYYPETHYDPTPRKFDFKIQNAPLMIM
jgi:hypothetical protein